MPNTDAYSARVADIIRQANEAAGRTPIKLATLTGISRETLKRRLTGGSPFTTYELALIAPYIGMSPTEILAAAEQDSAA
jgi:lambda repressor-like predicted transcriptional regulator